MDKYCEKGLEQVTYDEVLGAGELVNAGTVFSENGFKEEAVRALLEQFDMSVVGIEVLFVSFVGLRVTEMMEVQYCDER